MPRTCIGRPCAGSICVGIAAEDIGKDACCSGAVAVGHPWAGGGRATAPDPNDDAANPIAGVSAGCAGAACVGKASDGWVGRGAGGDGSFGMGGTGPRDLQRGGGGGIGGAGGAWEVGNPATGIESDVAAVSSEPTVRCSGANCFTLPALLGIAAGIDVLSAASDSCILEVSSAAG